MGFDRCYGLDGNQAERACSRRWPAFWVLLLLSAIPGCGGTPVTPAYNPDEGHLVKLSGDKQLQLGFFVDELKQKLVVTIMNAETQDPVAVSCEEVGIVFKVGDDEIPVKLPIDAEADNQSGLTSQFAIDFDQLPESIFGVAEFTAVFTLKVDGESVGGTLHHHDDHTHTHPHHD